MAKKAESVFWKWLRGKVLSEDPAAHFSRVENEADPGTPDLSFCVDSYEGTAELKYANEFPMGKRGLRPSQITWMRRRIRAGGKVRLIIGTKHAIYLLTGEAALIANNLDLTLLRYHAEVILDRHACHGMVISLFQP